MEEKRHFLDRDVCTNFILGMCPHDIFVNTKNDQGPCPKIHQESLKKAYRDACEKDGHDHGLPYRLLQGFCIRCKHFLMLEYAALDLERLVGFTDEVIRAQNITRVDKVTSYS